MPSHRIYLETLLEGHQSHLEYIDAKRAIIKSRPLEKCRVTRGNETATVRILYKKCITLFSSVAKYTSLSLYIYINIYTDAVWISIYIIQYSDESSNK